MKISNTLFNKLKEISPIVACGDKEKKKELKFKLLDDVQEAFGDKWYNLKEDTKQALQYACMRSTEQGFFFFGWKHLKAKYDISDSTIYNICKTLIKAKKLVRVNRTSTSQNGKGSAVYIFVNHPNFPAICDLLNIDWKTDCKADCKAESDEKPCGSKDESDISAPTYNLPTTLPKDLKDNVKHSNVNNNDKLDSYDNENDTVKILKQKAKQFEEQQTQSEHKKPSKFIKYVPKAINEKYGYFGDMLVDIWRKIKLAERKVCNEQMNDTLKMEIACDVIDNLKKNARFKVMSVDEMCAYVYKAHLNAMFNYLAELNVAEAMCIDTEFDYYAYLDKNEYQFPTNKPIVVDNRSMFAWWQQDVFVNQDMPF